MANELIMPCQCHDCEARSTRLHGIELNYGVINIEVPLVYSKFKQTSSFHFVSLKYARLVRGPLLHWAGIILTWAESLKELSVQHPFETLAKPDFFIFLTFLLKTLPIEFLLILLSSTIN